jgi:MFS family permease
MLITEANRKWWIFFATSLVLVMTNIDYTAVNLALAPIANDLHANLSTLQWIINGYSSAAAACAVIGGRLGDTYGYRKVFIAGVIIFTVASVLIGFATNAWSIILLRILQGAGGATCWPLCVVIISNVFPKDRQGYAIGKAMAIATIALAVGPTFGGVLLHFLNWRWIFFI